MSAATPRRIGPAVVALIALLCAMWGLQQVTVKLAIADGWPPFQLAAIRSAIALGCLLIWVAARTGAVTSLVPPRGVIGPAMLIGAGFAGEFLALYPGLRLTTASRGVVFLYTAPFFTAAGAHFFAGERLGARQVAGLAVAFGGVAIAFAGGLAGGGGSLRGDALCELAAVVWAGTTVLVKAVPGLREAGAAAVLAWQLAGSIPVLVAFALLVGEAWPAPSAAAWGYLLYQAVGVAFASYLAWFWLIIRYPAGRVSGFTFLTPVFGIAAGALIQGDAVGAGLVVGVVAIVVGLRLLNGP